MKTLFVVLMSVGFSLHAAQTDEDRIREAKADDHVVEAILLSPDMTFKMPVLGAAFRNTPEWEQRLQRIIDRESWSFAKVHFIHFYWKRVSKRNRNTAFMDRALSFVREYRRTDDTLGIVMEMLDSPEGPTKAVERTGAPASPPPRPMP